MNKNLFPGESQDLCFLHFGLFVYSLKTGSGWQVSLVWCRWLLAVLTQSEIKNQKNPNCWLAVPSPWALRNTQVGFCPSDDPADIHIIDWLLTGAQETKSGAGKKHLWSFWWWFAHYWNATTLVLKKNYKVAFAAADRGCAAERSTRRGGGSRCRRPCSFCAAK